MTDPYTSTQEIIIQTDHKSCVQKVEALSRKAHGMVTVKDTEIGVNITRMVKESARSSHIYIQPS